MGGKKILITGGLGNLGLWITEYLSKKNYEIYVLSTRSNLDSILIERNFQVIRGDIRDFTNLQILIPSEIDYIIHLASFNDYFLPDYPKKALEINSLGTRNILEIAKEGKIKRFIYFSTFHVYGASEGYISEETPTKPKNDYAITHLFAEQYIQMFSDNYNIPYTIFRLTNSYGAPKDINSSKWYLVLNDLSKMALEKGKIILKGNGLQRRDFVSMFDVCRVVEQSLNFVENGIYNLGYGKSLSILEIANIVRDVYREEFQKEIEIIINHQDTTKPQNLEVDISKIQKLINFKFQHRFSEEIRNIFKLLQNRKVNG